jgi:hypothetical protein
MCSWSTCQRLGPAGSGLARPKRALQTAVSPTAEGGRAPRPARDHGCTLGPAADTSPRRRQPSLRARGAHQAPVTDPWTEPPMGGIRPVLNRSGFAALPTG